MAWLKIVNYLKLRSKRNFRNINNKYEKCTKHIDKTQIPMCKINIIELFGE